MGTYIDYEDVAQRYKIFDSVSSIGIVNSDFIYYAEKEVESALSSVYSVPFSAAHPTVKDLCIEAVYVRYFRLTSIEKGEKLDKLFQTRLQRIRDGKEPIITGSGYLGGDLSGADLPYSTTEDYHPIHSLLDAEDNIIDSDLIDNLESERIDD